MKKNKFKLIFLFIITLTLTVNGENPGVSGSAFLKLESGARQSAIGGAGAVLVTGASDMFYNPALTTLNKNDNIYFAYNMVFREVYHNIIAYVKRINEIQTLGIGINFLSTDDIKRTRIDNPLGIGLGTYDQSVLEINVNYSALIIKDILAGFNIKYVKEKLENEKVDFLVADFGLYKNRLFEIFKRKIDFGLYIRNLGTKKRFYVDREKTPVELRAGIGIPIVKDVLTYYIDYNRYLEEKIDGFYNGIEYLMSKNLSAQIGYNNYSDDVSGFRAGFGYKYKNFEFDYAYLPHNDLDNIHRFSLQYNFDSGYDVNKTIKENQKKSLEHKKEKRLKKLEKEKARKREEAKKKLETARKKEWQEKLNNRTVLSPEFTQQVVKQNEIKNEKYVWPGKPKPSIKIVKNEKVQENINVKPKKIKLGLIVPDTFVKVNKKLEPIVYHETTVIEIDTEPYNIDKSLEEKKIEKDTKIVEKYGVSIEPKIKVQKDTEPVAMHHPTKKTKEIVDKRVTISPETDLSKYNLIRFHYFNYKINKVKFSGDQTEELSKLIDSYTKHKDKGAIIVVESNSCDIGDSELNYQLSKQRAENAKEYLLKNFKLVPDKIIIKYFGETRPVIKKHTPDARFYNRRTDFFLGLKK